MDELDEAFRKNLEATQKLAVLYLKKSTECYARGDLESGQMFRQRAFDARIEFVRIKSLHERKLIEQPNGAIRINKPV